MMETRSGKRRREQRERELREREEEELRWQEFAQRVKSLPPEVKRSIWTFSGISSTQIFKPENSPNFQNLFYCPIGLHWL